MASTKEKQELAQHLIREICEELCVFLISKNEAYGNSALEPCRIFSNANPDEQINVRIDDKISRIMQGRGYPGDNDIDDLAGYLVLKIVERKYKKEVKKLDGVVENDSE